ncbi:MAG TPA: hypothetical protein VF601_10005 [Beijerinckiaceae bacterium]|jgi:hypothetical protein
MAGWDAPSLAAVLACALACGLASCQTAGSPAGKPIAFESIEGAPAEVRTALAGELASAATARQVELVGTGKEARYRVRGYLTAERTADGGTALAFVWDVFDGSERRARRVTGSAPISAAAKKPGKNPWDGLDKEALARLAARSMDEIATFLAAGPAPAAPPEPAEEAASES